MNGALQGKSNSSNGDGVHKNIPAKSYDFSITVGGFNKCYACQRT